MIKSDWAEAQRVLAVRLDNLGDVLVTTPAIHAVRQSLPEAEITLLTSPVGAQVGNLNPDLDDVIVYRAPWMDPWQQLSQDSSREEALIHLLRERELDAAIIFTSFRQSSLPAAYLCYLADIPLRLGASIDGPGSLLTTRHRHPEVVMHEVERGLDLVAGVGMFTEQRDLVLAVPQEDRFQARSTLEQIAVATKEPGGPLVVIHPGCSMPARTYPGESYAEVADLLIEQLDATVLLTGTAGERELAESIQARMQHPLASVRAQIFAGDVDFSTFCALIEAVDLTVTNNTGPMHIAAAVKTPVISLFALTNPPEQWGPWMVPHRQLYHEVPCRLCYNRICPFNHECLSLVSADDVIEAASDLLGTGRYPSSTNNLAQDVPQLTDQTIVRSRKEKALSGDIKT